MVVPPQAPSRPEELTDEGHVLELAIQAGAEALLGLKDYLNELDSKAGDGDCGSTVRMISTFSFSFECLNIPITRLSSRLSSIF